MNINNINSFIQTTNNLTGKSILITPEGLGKSYSIIKHIVLNDNTSRLPIYSSHNIINSVEKIETAREIYKSNQSVSKRLPIRLKSDSEIFRDAIALQDESVAELFKNSSKISEDEGYIEYAIFAVTNDNLMIDRLNFQTSYKNKIKKLIESGVSKKEFNSIMITDMYNTLNKVKGKKCYYTIINRTESLNPTSHGNFKFALNFERIYEKYGNDLENLRHQAELNGCKLINLTSNSFKKMFKLKLLRNKAIKLAMEKPSDFILFAQNKVTEEYILKEADKNNVKLLLINDEVNDSDLVLYKFDAVLKVEKIINKINNNETITFEEKNLLKDLKINEKLNRLMKNNNNSIELDTVNIYKINDTITTTIGEPGFTPRLTFAEDTVVLTSEATIPTLLEHILHYSLYEIDSNYTFDDNNFLLFETDKETYFNATKAGKDKIKNFLNDQKECFESYNDVINIGTSYYGTDLTLPAVKGKNVHNYAKRINIIVNPSNFNRYRKFELFISKLIPSNKSKLKEQLLSNLPCMVRKDELNQAIARVSGLRRKYNTKTKTLFIYSNRDKETIDVLNDLRYKGVVKNNDFIKRYIRKINFSKKNIEKEVNLIKQIFDQSKFNNSFNTVYSIDKLKYDLNLTSKRIISLFKESISYCIIKMENNNYFEKFFNKKYHTKKFLDNITNSEGKHYRKTEFDINIPESEKNNSIIDYKKLINKLTNIINSNLQHSLIKDTDNLKQYNFDIYTFLMANFFDYAYKTVYSGKKEYVLNNLKLNTSYVYIYMHTISEMERYIEKFKYDIFKQSNKFSETLITFNPFDIAKSVNFNDYTTLENVIASPFIYMPDLYRHNVESSERLISKNMIINKKFSRKYKNLFNSMNTQQHSNMNRQKVLESIDFVFDNFQYTASKNYFQNYENKHNIPNSPISEYLGTNLLEYVKDIVFVSNKKTDNSDLLKIRYKAYRELPKDYFYLCIDIFI